MGKVGTNKHVMMGSSIFTTFCLYADNFVNVYKYSTKANFLKTVLEGGGLEVWQIYSAVLTQQTPCVGRQF